MMAIANLPTQRRASAQSSLVAKATRQEKSNKSFRVLMDIGPHLCSSVDIAAQYRGQRVMESWLNLGGRLAQSAFGPNFSTNWSTMLFAGGGVGAPFHVWMAPAWQEKM